MEETSAAPGTSISDCLARYSPYTSFDIKSTALSYALGAVQHNGQGYSPEDVLKYAKAFEEYLNGK